jgi:hypothetical protein
MAQLSITPKTSTTLLKVKTKKARQPKPVTVALNYKAKYNSTPTSCECPSRKLPCKHRAIEAMRAELSAQTRQALAAPHSKPGIHVRLDVLLQMAVKLFRSEQTRNVQACIAYLSTQVYLWEKRALLNPDKLKPLSLKAEEWARKRIQD